MKKYNCYEDIIESYSLTTHFECEGEIFDLVKYNSFPNHTNTLGVNIINIAAGIIIRVYSRNIIRQYTYYVRTDEKEVIK